MFSELMKSSVVVKGPGNVGLSIRQSRCGLLNQHKRNAPLDRFSTYPIRLPKDVGRPRHGRLRDSDLGAQASCHAGASASFGGKQ